MKYLMIKFSETELMTNTSAVLNHVANNLLPILITRKEGKSSVLISLEGYQAIEKLVDAMAIYFPEDLNNDD